MVPIMYKMLGHKNTAIAQIYVKTLNEKVEKNRQKFSHKFKEMKSPFVSQL